jgi:hypothetical protein
MTGQFPVNGAEAQAIDSKRVCGPQSAVAVFRGMPMLLALQ